MSTKHYVQAMEILLQSSGEPLADRHQTPIAVHHLHCKLLSN